MADKLQVLGHGYFTTGKQGARHYYHFTFEKAQAFIPGFRKFLRTLGFQRNADVFGKQLNESREPTNKDMSINDEILIDDHEFLEDEEYHIDLVFAHRTIIVLIASVHDQRTNMNAAIATFATPAFGHLF